MKTTTSWVSGISKNDFLSQKRNELGEEAFHEEIVIAWQYRKDELHTRLLNLMCTLDADNLERARLGFPDHVRALERYKRERGWWENVQDRHNLQG